MKRIKKEVLNYIIKTIIEKKETTQKDISILFNITERSVRRYYKILKDKNIIELKRNKNKTYWSFK